jgi:hypothetical protein
MSYLSKQDREIIKGRIVRLISEGLEEENALGIVGLHQATFKSWVAKDERFKRSVERAESFKYKTIIARSLEKLAKGTQMVDEVDEWIEECDERGRVKRKKTKREILPNVNAIQKLANKYCPEEYQDKDSSNITIKITQKDRSLTTEERLRILESDKSIKTSDDIEINPNDIKHIEDLLA